MSTQVKLQVIDADAHVVETDRTWDYLEPSEQKYRPLLYTSPNKDVSDYWLINGELGRPYFPPLSEQKIEQLSKNAGRNMLTPKEARELDDVQMRLDHMDQLGVDVQVLHNTIWLETVTTWPDTQAALCRSWNKWLANIWKQGKGRLRWSCVVPDLMVDEAIPQMRFAKENGAVAVCMKPLEGDRLLTDPYFHPIFAEAERLDMAIAIHIANGNRRNVRLWTSTPAPGEAQSNSGFSVFRGPTVILSWVLLMSNMSELFPNLRWGFIEASSQWVPWIYKEVENRYLTSGRPFPEDLFGSKKVYVSCETHDDLPWVLKYAGGNSLVIGTDYGHLDPSSDTNAILAFQQMDEISAEAKERILHHNPKRLYAL